jgi:hypothetical protein
MALFTVSLLAVGALAPDATAAQQDPIAPSALRQIGALLGEKASRTPAQRKISSRLLLEIKRRRDDESLAGLSAPRSRVEVDSAGRVLVDIKTEVGEELLARIEQLGGRVVSHHESFDAVRAELPLVEVETLAEWPALRSIRPAERWMTHGTTTTEGDHAHRADVLRVTHGVDGTGVKVGALSDSVDELAALQSSGELPMTVTVLAGQSGNGDPDHLSEGTALLEIIHDMAPGAELYFATGTGGEAQLAQNILDLAAAGCNVIVDEIGYLAEGVFQDGVVAQAVETVVAQGVLFFSAAGNSGNLNDGTSGVWEGDYSGMLLPELLMGAGVSAHAFAFEVGWNPIARDSPSFFTLQWADPLGGSSNDYDLFLLNPTRTTVFDSSTNIQDGDDDPYEEIDSLEFDDEMNVLVVVKTSLEDADRFFHLNAHRGELFYATDGQIFGHAGAAGAVTVAAVDVAGAGGAGGLFDGSESVEIVSSDGPRRVFFDTAGNPLTPIAASRPTEPKGLPSPVVRPKPDISAADGVSTTSSNFTTFFGTSAAAAHAAAVGALRRQMVPNLSTAAVRTLFSLGALDIEAPGLDRDSGAGILDAGSALDTVELFADGFESGDTSAWASP